MARYKFDTVDPSTLVGMTKNSKADRNIIGRDDKKQQG